MLDTQQRGVQHGHSTSYSLVHQAVVMAMVVGVVAAAGKQIAKHSNIRLCHERLADSKCNSQ
jgi:anthranilate phosphoribosyltransferase